MTLVNILLPSFVECLLAREVCCSLSTGIVQGTYPGSIEFISLISLPRCSRSPDRCRNETENIYSPKGKEYHVQVIRVEWMV